MPNIGKSTAANTTLAASGFSLFKTTGITGSMFLDTRSNIVAARKNAGTNTGMNIVKTAEMIAKEKSTTVVAITKA